MTTTRDDDNGWQRYHRRAQAVQDVLARLPRHGAPTLPWDDDLAAVFGEPAELLEALHGVWTRRLLARIDLALEMGTGTPQQSVEAGWQATADALPTLRALLDRYADSEVVHRCAAGEQRLMAVAAGLATLSDPAPYSARLGAGLVAGLQTAPPTSHRRTSGHRFGWLRGCRHVSAAA